MLLSNDLRNTNDYFGIIDNVYQLNISLVNTYFLKYIFVLNKFTV